MFSGAEDPSSAQVTG